MDTHFNEKDKLILQSLFKENPEFRRIASKQTKNKTRRIRNLTGGSNKYYAHIISALLCFVLAGGSGCGLLYLLMQPQVTEALGFVTPCRGTLSFILSPIQSYALGTMTCAERQQHFDRQLYTMQMNVFIIFGITSFKELYRKIFNWVEGQMRIECNIDEVTQQPIENGSVIELSMNETSTALVPVTNRTRKIKRTRSI
jgi:hypothetical protein